MRYKSNSGRVVSWVLAAIILVAIAFFVPFFWKQHKINDLNGQVSDLKSKLSQRVSTSTQPSQPTANATNLAQTSPNTYTSNGGVKITIYYPVSGAKVSSPLAVIGQVPGNWSNEASFPIKLLDSQGNTVAQATGHVLGNWMTSSLVPFSAQLTYSSTPNGNGKLVLQKDNPSGLAKNDDSLTIPIVFE